MRSKEEILKDIKPNTTKLERLKFELLIDDRDAKRAVANAVIDWLHNNKLLQIKRGY